MGLLGFDLHMSAYPLICALLDIIWDEQMAVNMMRMEKVRNENIMEPRDKDMCAAAKHSVPAEWCSHDFDVLLLLL